MPRGFFFFQAEDGIRDLYVTGVQTCALPISASVSAPTSSRMRAEAAPCAPLTARNALVMATEIRSEEHTSELQSRRDLVCRLLLEKNKKSPCQHRLQRDRRIRERGCIHRNLT